MRWAAALVLLTSCTQAARPNAALPVHTHDPLARWDATPKAPLSWSDFTPATFARAKAQGRFVVMDGAAEWCHWCHVMEAVSYHDPAVRKLLDEHFIAAKVDVDARPDIEERYADYGWPATVIFTPDGREIGKYRGFIDPERFAQILGDVVSAGTTFVVNEAEKSPPIPDAPMPPEMVAWIARETELNLEDYWDDKLGSWGHEQKAPLWMTNAWALSRAAAGDGRWKERILFTLGQQLAIIDPVWGGIYQYSTDSDWKHPHFEKLLYYNAGALDNYTEAYALTHDKKWLDAAAKIKSYIDRFLSSPEGGFYVTQDADLNAHEQGKRFVTGHAYYALGEAHRLALGVPRVDTHEYPQTNGLAIAAYARYASASGDATALERAKKAAAHLVATHAAASGALFHDEKSDAERVVHLGDNAAFAWGLLAIGDVAGAARIVDVLLGNLQDERGGGFFEHDKDPDAVGIFATRRKPFEDNVMMLRVLVRLARALPDKATAYRRAADRTLRAIATPEHIRDRGRMIGDFLLALTELQGT